MAKISKEEIALLKEMIADPSVPNDEKVLYNGILVSKKLFNKDKNVSCSACGVYSFKDQDTYFLKKWTTCLDC